MRSHVEVSFLNASNGKSNGEGVGIILILTASVTTVVGSISQVSIVNAMCSKFRSLPCGVFIASNGFIQPREE
jgi:hypothetical protein